MSYTLYREDFPEGKEFNIDGYVAALSQGWTETKPNVTIKEGKKSESSIIEHKRDDVGGLSTKASGSGGTKPSRERKGWPKGKKRKV